MKVDWVYGKINIEITEKILLLTANLKILKN